MHSKIKKSAITFTKMSGHGNDFIIISDLGNHTEINWSGMAQRYCKRRTSIGADGLLVVKQSNSADFTLRIFNADGSEAEMCGNGSRCAAFYAVRKGIAKPHMTFQTKAGLIEADVEGNYASIKMTNPFGLTDSVTVSVKNTSFSVYSINTGVPHTIVFTDLPNQPEVIKRPLMIIPDETIYAIGRTIRFNEVFAPEGTNVDFVEVQSENRIGVRTYERGVEEETLACGTGSVASAIISSVFRNVLTPPVYVETRGGDLIVDFRNENNQFTNVWLKGVVNFIYEGTITEEGSN